MFYKKRIEAMERLVNSQGELIQSFVKPIGDLVDYTKKNENRYLEDSNKINDNTSKYVKAITTTIEQISSLEKQIEELKAGLIKQNAQVQASALQKFDEWLNGAKQ